MGFPQLLQNLLLSFKSFPQCIQFRILGMSSTLGISSALGRSCDMGFPQLVQNLAFSFTRFPQYIHFGIWGVSSDPYRLGNKRRLFILNRPVPRADHNKTEEGGNLT